MSGNSTEKLPNLNFAGHKRFVTSVAFSRDSRYLASASNDKTTRIWTVKTQSSSTRLDHFPCRIAYIIYLLSLTSGRFLEPPCLNLSIWTPRKTSHRIWSRLSMLRYLFSYPYEHPWIIISMWGEFVLTICPCLGRRYCWECSLLWCDRRDFCRRKRNSDGGIRKIRPLLAEGRCG